MSAYKRYKYKYTTDNGITKLGNKNIDYHGNQATSCANNWMKAVHRLKTKRLFKGSKRRAYKDGKLLLIHSSV